jgi:hypothetical protein
MLERVHEHILAELGHSARIDTIVVVVAIVFDLIALGINSGAAANYGEALAQDLIFGAFIFMTLLFNGIALGGLLVGRSTRGKLLAGMLAMYMDNDVDKYYDKTLLSNYSLRYLVFAGIILVLMGISIMVPLLVRFV